MAIEIIKSGVVIRVNTADELRLVLSTLNNTGNEATRKPHLVARWRPGSASPKSPLTLSQFFHTLDKSKVYYGALLALNTRPEGMTDQELMKELKIEKGQMLGGSIGGLSKRAERVGLKLDDMITITEQTIKGVVSRHYTLTDKMREVMVAK
jgi:hypothetical protein